MDIDTPTVVTPSTKTASHRMVLNASHRLVQNASHSITNADNECELVDKEDVPLEQFETRLELTSIILQNLLGNGLDQTLSILKRLETFFGLRKKS